jgi:hypothetical protein
MSNRLPGDEIEEGPANSPLVSVKIAVAAVGATRASAMLRSWKRLMPDPMAEEGSVVPAIVGLLLVWRKLTPAFPRLIYYAGVP